MCSGEYSDKTKLIKAIYTNIETDYNTPGSDWVNQNPQLRLTTEIILSLLQAPGGGDYDDVHMYREREPESWLHLGRLTRLTHCHGYCRSASLSRCKNKYSIDERVEGGGGVRQSGNILTN